jgi:hypothetical protein
MSIKNLIPVWDPSACIPREEILQGRLTDAELALHLPAVVKGRARPPYDDPVTFFEATYLTRNLKDIIEYVFGRLSGSRHDVNPIIMLDVGFGGGKTHAMVALYYAAKYPSKVKQFLNDIKIPSKLNVVTISGDEYGDRGVTRDNYQVQTLWGDLFVQLGVYDRFKQLDKEKALPSLEDICQAIGDTPVLILLDELPTYLNLVSKSDEAMLGKTTQFIQRLVAAVSERDKAMLLIAIAEDVYRTEAGYIRREISQAAEEHLADAKAHLRRKQTVFSPIEETDAVHILKRRLFVNVNTETAKNTAEQYHKMYTGGISVPDSFKKKEYQDEIEACYPFHPALIKVLYERVATLDTFQRTRGSLRLLNKVVRRIWREKEEDAFLISPYHVDLAEADIANDLTHELGESKLRNAVEADIWRTGGGAIAQSLDEEIISHWKVPLHRRVANVIFLYSLASGKILDRGIDAETLVAVTINPGREDHALKIRDQVLKRIQEGHYIDRRGENFYFSREPNPLRVIDREARNVTDEDAMSIVRDTIATLFSDKPDWVHVEIFPMDPSKLEDTPIIKLAILNPQLKYYIKSENQPTPSTMSFLNHRDSQGKTLRKYRNDTFILVADEQNLKNLWNSARKLQATREIRKDLHAYGIPEDKKEAVEEQLSTQEKAINDTIRHTFSIFGFTDKKGEQKFVRMNPNGYSGGRRGKEMFAYHLKEIFKRIVEEPLDPGYVETDVWPSASTSVSSETLFETFHSKPGCIIPVTQGVFVDTLKRGIEEGTWVVKHGEKIWTKDAPPRNIPIDASVEIWGAEEAALRGIIGGRLVKEGPPTKQPTKKTTKQINPGFHSFSPAPAKSLASDLTKIAKKYNLSVIDKAIIQLSGAPIALFQIRNLLKRLESDKDLKCSLRIESNYFPEGVELSITLSTNKEGMTDQNVRTILDSIPKIKSESFKCVLTLEKRFKTDELADYITQLDKEDSVPYKLEISWPVEET